jgi:hypothetical protein
MATKIGGLGWTDSVPVFGEELKPKKKEPPELKPCPFCGGTNVVVKQDHCLVSGHRYWFITHSMPSRECPLVDSFDWWHSRAKFTTKEKAIEAWNRRVGST